MYNCAHIKTHERCINHNRYKNNENKSILKSITDASWKRYSSRLTEVSENTYKRGELEYETSNEVILDKILNLNSSSGEINNNFLPTNLSLATTRDGSIHYTFRLGDSLSLFIETYINEIEENETYIQFFQDEHLLYQECTSIDSGLDKVKNIFKKIIKKFDLHSLNPMRGLCPI